MTTTRRTANELHLHDAVDNDMRLVVTHWKAPTVGRVVRFTVICDIDDEFSETEAEVNIPSGNLEPLIAALIAAHDGYKRDQEPSVTDDLTDTDAVARRRYGHGLDDCTFDQLHALLTDVAAGHAQATADAHHIITATEGTA